MIGALVGLIVAAVAAAVVFGVVMAVLGLAFGLVFGLLALCVKAIPFLLLGWIAVKLVRRVEHPRGLSASDRAWLDTRA